ncbi:MAG: HRDC domain-containing protein [Alphaproteobacteria bacterium]|jgi:ribonuclease D|nr:HRDC domain-containing protein [Alphaproteobacteria bacterium]
MEYQLVENQKELDSYIAEMKKCEYLAIDTEFIRRSTYYPKLSLIQICFKPKFAIIIDCLSTLNLDVFIDEIIYNPKIIKVFHSSKQDLEIFYYKKKSLPTNVFDTQLAVMLINFTKDISYEKMVKDLLNTELDKSLSTSNWLQRPLSKEQQDYASNDVLYLYEAYTAILKLLEKHNRLTWLENLFDSLEDVHTYENSIEKDLTKATNDLSKESINIMYSLLMWREEHAKKIDIPRSFLLDTEVIKEISKKAPATKEDLKKIVGSMKDRMLKTIFEIVQSPAENPIIIKRNPSLNKSQAEIYNILRVILSHVATTKKVHNSLIASNDDLIDVVFNKENSQAKFLNGWRFEIFGSLVLDFLEEKKSLKIKGNKISLE